MRYHGTAMNRPVAHTLPALIVRDLRDAVVNPTVLMMAAASFICSGVFYSIGRPEWIDGMDGRVVLLALVLMVTPTFCGYPVLFNTMLDERIKGMSVTLLDSGVSVGSMAVSKFAAAFAVSSAVAIVQLAVWQVPLQMAAPFFAVLTAASVPVFLICFISAALARAKETDAVASVVAVVVAVVPFLGFLSDVTRPIGVLMPTGPAFEAVRMLCGGQPILPVPALFLIGLLWAIACIAVAIVAARIVSRDIHSKAMREGAVGPRRDIRPASRGNAE